MKGDAGAHLHLDITLVSCPTNRVGTALQCRGILGKPVSRQTSRQTLQVRSNWIQFEKIVGADITNACALVGHRRDKPQCLQIPERFPNRSLADIEFRGNMAFYDPITRTPAAANQSVYENLQNLFP
jgi:hypothetical protein